MNFYRTKITNNTKVVILINFINYNFSTVLVLIFTVTYIVRPLGIVLVIFKGNISIYQNSN